MQSESLRWVLIRPGPSAASSRRGTGATDGMRGAESASYPGLEGLALPRPLPRRGGQ